MVKVDVLEITQRGTAEGVEPITIYVGALPAGWLALRADIDRWSKDHREGYQRPVLPSRLMYGRQSVVRYLLEEMGTFPTSVLLNIREDIRFQPEAEIFQNIRKGKLEIPDDRRLWIIDGQHRVEALKVAMQKNPELREYPLPVSILNLKEIFDEMLLFYIVNSRQKKIPVNVAYRHLQQMKEQVDIKGKYKWLKEVILGPREERQATAALIVDFLNDEETSPFYNRIRYPGEEAEPHHLIEDSVLIRYISKILSEKSFELMAPVEFAQLFVMYWNAIKGLYPNAFKEDRKDEYTILKHTGVASFTYLFPEIYGICAREANITEERMSQLLGYLLLEVKDDKLAPDFQRPLTEEWWSRAHGPYAATATSEKVFTANAQQMAEKIRIARGREETKT